MRGTEPKKYPGITEIKKGQIYNIRLKLPYDPIRGCYPDKEEHFHGTLRQAIDRRNELKVEAKKGKVRANGYTVDKLFTEYFAHAENELSPTTVKNYRSSYNAHVKDKIGKRRATDITARDIDILADTILKKGVKPQTVNRCLSMMSSAWSKGKAWQVVAQNPVKEATRRKPQPIKKGNAKAPDVLRMIEYFDNASPATGRFFRLALLLGARRGEICALQVGDFNKVTGKLTISKAIRDGQTGPTKTHGTREFPVTPKARKTILAQIASLGEFVPSTAYLFSDDGGKTPWRPDRVSLAQRRIRERMCPNCPNIGQVEQKVCECGTVLGVYFRLHDLRHLITSTLLRQEGVSSRSVQHQMGWDDEHTMRKFYNDYDEDDAVRTVDAIERAFG